ncbi:Cytochrome P450 monooxygenase himC [Hyphodiscus hymeniophilus]|uniref:Cytochrome P450 monooxygenase himC n=1 Tax=Hyphodiscus hymeniophilus TaxID=353542 RepID=A0A9P6VQ59_9HELO|nr:Cytochrome P450 monooxygenase himC [Hyphodiscus hymeniophilus]
MAFLVFGLAVLIFAFIVRRATTSIVRARSEKQRRCKSVYRIPQFERVIGYALYRTQVTAMKNKNAMEVNLQRYLDNGETWSAVMMGNTFFNTIDPRNVQEILGTKFEDFGTAERLAAFGPLLGKGIFTTDGNFWKTSRALVKPNFNRSQVADLEALESHIQQLFAKIPRDGSTFDLQKLFFQLTLDSATEFLFGESVHSLTSSEDSEQQRFEAAFDLAQAKLGIRYRRGKFIRFSDIFMPDYEFKTACKTVHEFVDKIVGKALERSHPKDAEKVIEEKDEVERYVFLKELAKATRDPQRLRDELLNILLAGRDTTASLLSSTFHVLVRRPDILEKLRKEVDELHGVKPNYDTLKSMKYLKYILNETLRLYPVVPTNARVAVKDTTLSHGGGPDRKSPVFIPKGQVVAYSVYCMHRRKDIYGEDALEFKPERWAPKPEGEESLRPAWGYLPFNGGPRVCVGQQFALTEASYAIVRLLQEFAVVEDRDGGPFVEQLSLTMVSANGVKVAVMPI